MKNKALITGITGQDGSYLAELLLSKGYEVHGIVRRSSTINTNRIDHIYEGPKYHSKNFFLHYGDVIDGTGLSNIINRVRPNEIYNLAAQSHVAVSFETPEYTTESDALGVLKILEIIRSNTQLSEAKFYQASTSELFGKVLESPQKETTPFCPRSPYGIAKQYAYWITKNYREAYGIFACNGILFNHESPRRGETFVTRKITRGLASILHGKSNELILGNLDAKRDWGHAKDYVMAIWLMLQQDEPDDFVIATGKQYSIRQFIEICLDYLGVKICWEGNGVEECGIVESSKNYRNFSPGKKIIQVNSAHFRPTEVDSLLGDSTKAQNQLNWKPTISLEDLAIEMIENDIGLQL